MEFGNLTDLFDVVIQFSKVVDRRPFDVLVCEKSVPSSVTNVVGVRRQVAMFVDG